MRARSRWLYGLAATCLLGCLAVPQSAAAAPCAPVEDDDLVSLSAPRLLTFARDAAVFVNAFDEDMLATRIENARLEYLNSYGEVFFSRLLTSRDIAYLADDTPLRFPIRAELGAGPLLVRLSYTQRSRSFDGFGEEDGERTCEVERQSTVRPFAGVPPRPVMDRSEPLGNGMASFGIFLGATCEQLAPGALRVVVRHHRWKRAWGLRSKPCGRTYVGEFPRWKGQGSILPGLRGHPFEGFQIVARRLWTRHYRVDVVWNGKTLLRRWVRIRIVSYEPARRLYERDSEFDEICLFEGSKGDAPPPRRDAEGRRYCVVGSRMFWRGKILKTRP
jgi:hypothetical protein